MLAIVVGFNSAKSNASEVKCLYVGPSRQEARKALNAGGPGIVRSELYVNPMYHERGKFGGAPVIEVPAEGDEEGKKEYQGSDLIAALAEVALQNTEINRLNALLAERDKEISDLRTTLADVNQMAEERSGTIAEQERELLALRAKVTALESAGTQISGDVGEPGGDPPSPEPGASVENKDVTTDASAPSGGNLPLGLPEKPGAKKK